MPSVNVPFELMELFASKGVISIPAEIVTPLTAETVATINHVMTVTMLEANIPAAVKLAMVDLTNQINTLVVTGRSAGTELGTTLRAWEGTLQDLSEKQTALEKVSERLDIIRINRHKSRYGRDMTAVPMNGETYPPGIRQEHRVLTSWSRIKALPSGACNSWLTFLEVNIPHDCDIEERRAAIYEALGGHEQKQLIPIS
ncbi:hypothetical protein CI109_100523 [Kwoniella shandongensis]|uniref:Uncharacterized protein n=1 Tax=Kwoniella shandongensis TaxID=1734106 RepID=A0A5M6BNN9_9TREE|nr:uncharacterized protein CI109_007364 [Kwoniella shandongensis]KAA5524317.1 hypothetical protein CI109_007364 [Kwoniella shandongensis]